MNSEWRLLPTLEKGGTGETGGGGVLWVRGTDLAIGERGKKK